MTERALAGLDPEAPHRRQNLLTGDWVLVSPHRTKRPWQGRVEDSPARRDRPRYDPDCYLCPDNARAGGAVNPGYDGVFVFDNDFAALTPDIEPGETVPERRGGVTLRARSERGTCRVVCFSPRHDLTLPELGAPAVRALVDAWAREYEELGARPYVNYVQIFENRGEVMGASNPHPHGQIWAQESIPGEPAKEGERLRRHFEEHGRSLLSDYLDLELDAGERVVLENDDFVALVPFWAVWPFETLVVSRSHRRSLLDLSDGERDGLADVLRRLTTRYDNLFRVSFPYSAGLHQAPTDGGDHQEWHLHMHFYPPLLRSATVKKFMVGYEMLAEPQRDITAESSAQRLRGLSETHYAAAGSGGPGAGPAEGGAS